MSKQRILRWISESDSRRALYENSEGNRDYRSMKTLLVISLILFFAGSSYGWVSYYPNSKTGDCNNYNIPVLPRPNKWGTYVDPTFGITVRRFTNWYYEYGPGGTNQNPKPPIIQYSTFTCTNADNTKVVFKIGDRNALFYTTGGTFLRFKYFGPPGPGYGDMELRWSYFDPDVMYYRQYTRFYKYNYSTNTSTLLREFKNDVPTAVTVDNNDKGEQSWTTDEYFAFRMQGTGGDTGSYLKLICYKPSTNEVWMKDVGEYYNERGIDHLSTYPRAVSMSPSGKYLIAYFGGRLKGEPTGVSQSHVALFARTAPGVLSWVRDIAGFQIAHMAQGYDHEGLEAVWSFNEPHNTIHILDTGQRFDEYERCHDCLSALPCVYPSGHGKHQSSSPALFNGWRIVSTYANSKLSTSDYWLDRMIYAVRSSTDKNKVIIWRLAHVQSHQAGYNDQSRTQISRDGKYIYFDSNWMGTDPNTREIYRLEMPDNWWNLIEPGDPPTKVIQPAIDTSPPAAPINTSPPAAPGGLKIIK